MAHHADDDDIVDWLAADLDDDNIVDWLAAAGLGDLNLAVASPPGAAGTARPAAVAGPSRPSLPDTAVADTARPAAVASPRDAADTAMATAPPAAVASPPVAAVTAAAAVASPPRQVAASQEALAALAPAQSVVLAAAVAAASPPDVRPAAAASPPVAALAVAPAAVRKRCLKYQAHLMRAAKAARQAKEVLANQRRTIREAIKVMEAQARRRRCSRRLGLTLQVSRAKKGGVPLMNLEVRGCGAGPAATKKIALPLSLVLQVGLDDSTVSKRVAAVHGVSDRTAKRCRQLVAGLLMSHYEQRLQKEAQRPEPISFVVSALAWDETSETLRLRLPLESQNSFGVASTVWHVLVSEQRLLVGGGDGVRRFDPIRPTVPLMRTSAACTYRALMKVPCVMPLVNTEARLLARADIRICHFERDAANVNNKLVAHVIRQRRGCLCSDLTCGNHQTQLVDASVLNAMAMGTQLISRLYSVSLLFRMGANWLRMIHAVPRVVIQRLRVLRGKPPASAFGKEFRDYLATNRQVESRYSKYVSPTEMPSAFQAQQQFQRRLDALLAVCNGPLGTAPWTHYCANESCCSGYDLVVTQRRMSEAIVGFFFCSLPTIPSPSKWTKTGPCLDWVLGCLWVHSALPQIMDEAFSRAFVSSTLGAPRNEDDQLFTEEVAWRQLEGKRMRLATEFFRKPDISASLTILALVKEPLRWLTCVFLKCAKSLEEPTQWPPLCDLCRKDASCVTSVLQYYSYLCTGEAARLCLLFRGQSPDAWQRHHTTQALEVRRVVLVAASWVHERHVRRLQTWPWRLASLPDTRLPLDERQAVAKEFWDTPRCCLDGGFSRRLKESLHEWQELLRPQWMSALLAWASTVRCTMAHIEFKHAKNRRRAHPQMSWEQFTALYVTGEAKASLILAERAAQAETVRARAVVPFDQVPGPGPPKERRHKTALALFRSEAMSRDRTLGIAFNPCSKSYWDKVKADFARLPENTRQIFENRAALLRHAAQAQRRRSRCAAATTAATAAAAPAASPAAAAPVANPAPLPSLPSCPSETAMVPFVRVRVGPEAPPQQEDLLLALRQRKTNLHSLADQFRKTHETTAGDDPSFPAEVRYQKSCGPLCRRVKHYRHEHILRYIRTIASSFAKPTLVPAGDVLLAFEVMDRVHWAALVSASKHSGCMPARENLVQYVDVDSTTATAVKGRGWSRVRLRLARMLRVTVRPSASSIFSSMLRAPFDEQPVGTLRHFSSEEWVCELGIDAEASTRIALHKVLWKSETLDTLLTTGLDPDVPSFVLPTEPPPPRGPEPPVLPPPVPPFPPSGPGLPGPRGGEDSDSLTDSDSEPDWLCDQLSELMATAAAAPAAALPPPARTPTVASPSGPSASASQPTAAPALVVAEPSAVASPSAASATPKSKPGPAAAASRTRTPSPSPSSGLDTDTEAAVEAEAEAEAARDGGEAMALGLDGGAAGPAEVQEILSTARAQNECDSESMEEADAEAEEEEEAAVAAAAAASQADAQAAPAAPAPAPTPTPTVAVAAAASRPVVVPPAAAPPTAAVAEPPVAAAAAAASGPVAAVAAPTAAVAEPPAAAGLAQALELTQATTKNDLCRILGIEVTSSWNVLPPPTHAANAQRLGFIRAFGMALKCTCKLPGHAAACTLLVNTRDDLSFDSCEVLLLKWLCAGSGSSGAQHLALRDNIRREQREAAAARRAAAARGRAGSRPTLGR